MTLGEELLKIHTNCTCCRCNYFINYLNKFCNKKQTGYSQYCKKHLKEIKDE